MSFCGTPLCARPAPVRDACACLPVGLAVHRPLSVSSMAILPNNDGINLVSASSSHRKNSRDGGLIECVLFIESLSSFFAFHAITKFTQVIFKFYWYLRFSYFFIALCSYSFFFIARSEQELAVVTAT